MTNGVYPWETGEQLSAAALNAAIAMGQSNQWYSVAGPPVDATGKDGDMWLNTTTGDIYQRQSGHYVLQANIRGPAGAPGASTPGPPGPPGPSSGGTVTNIATSGSGISGGPISVAGTLSVAWNGPAVTALGSNLSAAGGTLQVTGSPPASFSSLTGVATYTQLPPEVQQVPISFPFSGKPPGAATINLPMPWAVTIPAGLAGTVVYDGTRATASATFAVNKISGGSTTALGTVTVTTGSNNSATLAGAGGSLAVGDVLQMVTPVQDATLADLGITLLAARV